MSSVRSRSLTLVALLGLLAACGGDGGTVSPPPPPTVATVAVAPGPQVNVVVGGNAQLTASVRDEDGNALAGHAVTWSSSAIAVASVGGTGVVTGVAVGSAQVRATSEGKFGEVTVNVTTVPVASVTLAAVAGPLVPLQALQLTATAKDGGGNTLSGRAMTWNSSAIGVATVSGAGVVTAVTPGNATITATSEGKSATVDLTVGEGSFVAAAGATVTAQGGKVTLVIPALALAAGTPISVAALAAPPTDPKLVVGTSYEFGPTGTQFAQPVTMSITYDALAAVGKNAALFRLHRWNGTAWQLLAGGGVNTTTRVVTAPTSSFSTYAVLEIPAPVATVTITPSPVALKTGETAQLQAVLRDAGNNILTGRAVQWTSLNQAVATVSASGVVTGVTVGGPVTIRATSEEQIGTVSVTVSAPFALATIGAGYAHTCGANNAGVTYCWGANGESQLVDLTIDDRNYPLGIVSALRFAKLTAGSEHVCALTTAGAAYCWGDNNQNTTQRGMVGDGTIVDRDMPTPVSGGRTYSAITAGLYHNCAMVAGGGSIFCWGSNEDGELGDGTFTTRLVPVQVQTPAGVSFRGVSSSGYHTCALSTTGVAYCWGYNGEGELGDGTHTDRNAPVLVSGGHTFESISVGGSHTCARKASGEVWCWGWNSAGQLGDGTTTERTIPVLVSGGNNFTLVAAGGEFTCGILVGGPTKCWGYNLEGNLGDGTTTQRLAPVTVSGSQQFTALFTGGYGYHTCGITATQLVYCWGWNGYGQLGDGSNTNRSAPTRIVDGVLPTLRTKEPAAETPTMHRDPRSGPPRSR